MEMINLVGNVHLTQPTTDYLYRAQKTRLAAGSLE